MKISKLLLATTAFAMTATAVAAGNPNLPVQPPAQSPIIFSDGFDNVNSGNWIFFNASSSPGQGWFQGNAGVFSAHSGASNSYIAADFSSSQAPNGTVDNWLISPTLTLNRSSTLSFFTRTADAGFNDKLEVRFSAGSGTDVSTFTTVLTTVGGDGSFPADAFQRFTATLPVTGTGRFAFRYTGNALETDYIGIDTLAVTAVPEPSTYAMMGLGLAALALVRRKSKQSL